LVGLRYSLVGSSLLTKSSGGRKDVATFQVNRMRGLQSN
jgi:hypothetical protein